MIYSINVISIHPTAAQLVMFNPVKVTGAYAELTPSIGPVFGPTINGPTSGPSYRGGPVYGLADVSQPNTSPDTLTINGTLHFEDEYHGHGQTTDLPSGTPVVVVFDNTEGARDRRHHEPIHRIFTHVVPEKYFVNGDRYSVMITVLVGTAKFKRNVASHCAVAVQNVATVFMTQQLLVGDADDANGGHIAKVSPIDMKLGDIYFIAVVADAQNGARGAPQNKCKILITKNLGTVANPHPRVAGLRVLRICATPLQNELKCDLGRMAIAL